MKFDFLCLTLFNWEIGVMLGGDDKKFTLLKITLPSIEIASITVFAFKLIEISF